ncbi:MAG: hypothetical protein GX879_03145, partial [Bacteroidales bacterium]|nr:hypothetical protein [Bacteroidales bacterium]
MKRTHISFLIFIIIICFSSLFSNKAEAQKLSVNLLPAENKVYQQAQSEFDNENYVKAKEYYSQLLSLYPREAYFNYYYGACMVNLNSEFYKSIDYLEYALRGEVYQANYYLGKAYHLNYMFSKALEYYEAFLKSASTKDLKNFPIDRQIKMAENGIYLIKFTYELKVLKNKKVNQSNFYYSYDIPHTGGEIVVIPEEFRSKIDKRLNYKGLMYVSKVFDIAFFSSYGNSKGNSLDIYMVRKENEKWGQATLLPSAINTDEDEAYPFFHPSGEYLYFSSKGHNSMGGYDIFKVPYNRFTNSWGQAENLDFPINTPLDDIMYITDSRDISAYFASTRESDINKIGVYQILIEQDPLQRLVESMTDLLKTAKLETNPAAIIEYDRIIEEIRISESELFVDSVLTPEDTEKRRIDSILINEEYELITNISNQLDKLESNYQDFRLQYFAALSLIEQFIENTEKVEEKYKAIEHSNLKNIEKQAQLSEINDEIKEYADSIIAIKTLAEAHENIIHEIDNKKNIYRTEADELFSKRDHSAENNKELKNLSLKLNQSLEIVPENLKLKENNKLLAENESKTNRNDEEIIRLNTAINKIDEEVIQLYDSLSASEFIQIQTNLTQKISSLEYQRKTLVAEYKETYLQQQFLSTETKQVQRINDIAEQHIPLPVEGINEYSENAGRRILAKTNYYIQRRNQLNLEDMAKAQEKIIDSIFFDNTKLLTQKFESENKKITVKQNTNFKQIVIINEIINTQNFDTHNIEKYANQAQNIIAEMALLDDDLSMEADINKRRNIIDKFNDKEEYLNQVFDKINAEIKEFNDNVFVEEIIPNSKQNLRDFTQANIDSLREIGKETDIALAENYLNSADSLYALAAAISQDDTKISSAQDYYLKQALLFENKAVEIVATEDSYAFASEIEAEEKLIAEKQNAVNEIIRETHQSIVNIQDENESLQKESLNLAELTNSYYDNAEKLINEANSTSKQKKKTELFEQAAKQWQEAENTHAQLAKNELNNSIEEFYVIDKAFENIEKINADNLEFEEVYIIKQEAENLHKEAGNLLIKAEEVSEITEKNKLIINAVELEKQATEKYKNAYNLISDTDLPETEYASNLIKTQDENKFEEIAQILEEKSSEEDKAEISINLISEKYNTIIKSKIDKLDSLMVVNENTNNEILVLESNYLHAENENEKEQVIEEITVLQNERTQNYNSANQIIFEIQNDKINYNSELIETIAYLDRKNKSILKEINKKQSKYSSEVEKLQYEASEHYFVMLAEVVILGNEIIEAQNEIINKIEADLSDELADIGEYQNKLNVSNKSILKTNEWLSEQESIIAQAKTKKSEISKLEIKITEEENIVENIYFSENEKLISENTKKIQEIENNEFGKDLKFKQQKSEIKELEIRINSLKEDTKNSTNIEDTQELTNKFEKLEIELISKQEQYLTNVKNLLAYSENQQNLKNKAQKNKEVIAKFNSNNENINSAIYRAEIAENLLNQKADSIGNLIEVKYENLESNEIKKLQNEEIELRKRALSLSADAIEIITNDNENLAQEININYGFIEYTYKEKPEEFIAEITENEEIIAEANKTEELFIDANEIKDSIIETTETEKLIAETNEKEKLISEANKTEEFKVHETEKTYTDSEKEGEIKPNIEVEKEIAKEEIVYSPENESIKDEESINQKDDYELEVINLPEIEIFANTDNMSKSEQKAYQKILKERNTSKLKINILNEKISKLENRKQTARTENKINKLQDKRSNYITDYYATNSQIISIEAEQLVAKYSEINPLFIENKKHADSLLIIAENNKKQAEILWNKALAEQDNKEKSMLLYQVDSLINEHLALHQKSIEIIESNESIKPIQVVDYTDIDDLAGLA